MRIALLLTAFAVAMSSANAQSIANSPSSDPIKIAVFEFELEDVTPAGALEIRTTKDESLRKMTAAARDQLESSGRYSIVDLDGVDIKSITNGRMLQDCDGCETQEARKLGAQQSMIGYVRRATQTDYYIVVAIRDTATGELLKVEAANFIGGEQGWATGARQLLRHQILRP
ncbi:MAG: DUF2380 domain-containing protein [Pseudomonadota bacterium]